MAKKQPVNIKQQIIFIYLPILSLYAYYRIEKIKKGIINSFISGIISAIITNGILFTLVLNNVESTVFGILYIVMGITVFIVSDIVLSIREIRKWSEEWNKKYT